MSLIGWSKMRPSKIRPERAGPPGAQRRGERSWDAVGRVGVRARLG